MEINRTEPGNFWPGFPFHVTLTSACLSRLEELGLELESFIPLPSLRQKEIDGFNLGKNAFICLCLEP